MGLGDFTKQEAKVATECAVEIFEAVSKAKRMNLLGAYNELLTFIAYASKHAPDAPEAEVKS